MKNLILMLLISCYITTIQAQNGAKNHDSTAIFILDKMADLIGDMKSVSFDLSTTIDTVNSKGHIEKLYTYSKISFSGPNKLKVEIDGTSGKKGFWYDGDYLSFYNFDENNYVTLEAPESTLEMIDEMHKNYNFKFPAADFFYPNFTDDMMEQFETITFLGTKQIKGENLYHIQAINKNLNVQLWLSNDFYMLPKHFVIIYKNKSNLQYQSTFNNWQLNPSIPDAIFDFLPPPKARLISILKK